MSTKAQVQAQAKMPVAPAAMHVARLPEAVPEREAERPDIATQLEGAARLGHSLGGISVDGAASPAVQRSELPEEEASELEPTPDQSPMGPEGGSVPPDVESAIRRARGGGRPLDAVVQAQLGERLGHDFSGVRVHADTKADGLSRRLSANAFATGQDIFFRRGAYSPASSSGQTLIAHELTHVVQQRTGQIQPAQGSGFSLSIDPELERKADEVAATGARDGDFGIIGPGRETGSLQVSSTGTTSRPGLQTAGVESAHSTAIQPQPDEHEAETLWEMEEAAKRARAYHATRIQNLEIGERRGILRQGLQPSHGGRGGAGEQVESQHFMRRSQGKVHFTTNPETARFYQGSVFGGPEHAEILKLAMPLSIARWKERDPDDRREAFRVRKAIRPELIRRTAPAQIPGPRPGGAARVNWEAGTPAYEHQLKGDAELGALMSYMPEFQSRDASSLSEDEITKLYMMRNALRAQGKWD